MQENNILMKKSLDFAVRIVNMSNYVKKEKHEKSMSEQVLRSATSIGANIREAKYGASRADFINKLQIALKETAETEFWICVLTETGYIDQKSGNSLLKDCLDIKHLLIASINTSKKNKEKG
ncbi:MAG: four helix bundle protein [Acutalibacteraceae bacterium]